MSILLLAETGHHVSPGITALFATLLVGLIICLALEEKIHAKKSVIAGCFAVACLLLGAIFHILPFQEVVVGSHLLIEHDRVEGDYEDENDNRRHVEIDANTDEIDGVGVATPEPDHDLHLDGHRISMPVYIPAIDWGVIAIILGSSLFVDITSKSGLFTWIAIKVTKASRGDPLLLLIFYGVMTVVFSAVLNNVTAMIIVGSLTAVSLEKLNRSTSCSDSC